MRGCGVAGLWERCKPRSQGCNSRQDDQLEIGSESEPGCWNGLRDAQLHCYQLRGLRRSYKAGLLTRRGGLEICRSGVSREARDAIAEAMFGPRSDPNVGLCCWHGWRATQLHCYQLRGLRRSHKAGWPWLALACSGLLAPGSDQFRIWSKRRPCCWVRLESPEVVIAAGFTADAPPTSCRREAACCGWAKACQKISQDRSQRLGYQQITPLGFIRNQNNPPNHRHMDL